jgi:hypothetical protein
MRVLAGQHLHPSMARFLWVRRRATGLGHIQADRLTARQRQLARVPRHSAAVHVSPPTPRTLLIVGSNPPTTSGERTRARAEQARQALGYDEVRLANIFSIPTYRTGGIAASGVKPDGWLEARRPLLDSLEEAAAVLLAYGVSRPAGAAALHHRAQISWLETQIRMRHLPVFLVGGEPRHPSRWQRYTFRAYPGESFPVALKACLKAHDPGTTQLTADSRSG